MSTKPGQESPYRRIVESAFAKAIPLKGKAHILEKV